MMECCNRLRFKSVQSNPFRDLRPAKLTTRFKPTSHGAREHKDRLQALLAIDNVKNEVPFYLPLIKEDRGVRDSYEEYCQSASRDHEGSKPIGAEIQAPGSNVYFEKDFVSPKYF